MISDIVSILTPEASDCPCYRARFQDKIISSRKLASASSWNLQCCIPIVSQYDDSRGIKAQKASGCNLTEMSVYQMLTDCRLNPQATCADLCFLYYKDKIISKLHQN
jgi:hypothetical protein